MSANADAVGLAREALETPALCLDLNVYRRNVGRMVDYIVRKHGLAWRPHMKGQKAPQLAVEAVKAGAIGVTCATLYEAEAMARAGVESILIAHEIVGERKLDRLARLVRAHPGVIVATDSLAHARMLAAAAARERLAAPIAVLIEVNVGMNRCGCAPGETAVDLAREITTDPELSARLRLAGLMGWEGHALAGTTVAAGEEAKRETIWTAMTALAETAAACRAADIDIGIVSAAGSGTFRVAAEFAAEAGITEVQAGGGVFSDLSYEKWGLGDHEFALTVLTRVVSRPAPGRAIVDGGFKTMSVQHGLPRAVGIEGSGVKSVALSAEHGTLEFEGDTVLKVGELVEFVPGYTDSTVCLHDEMCVLQDGKVVAVWAIPGRTGRRG